MLQNLFGGENLLLPKWLEMAYSKLQATNSGYHLGRYVNCVEVSMLAYKAILEGQGLVFPRATPLPNLPDRIPNYIATSESRLFTLDSSKKAKLLLLGHATFAKLVETLKSKKIPPYSHCIIFVNLDKMPGFGHALSGFWIPSETGELNLYLYDAQGFLPYAWLHPEEFNKFYSVFKVFVYDSVKTQQSLKVFIDRCKTEALLPSEEKPISSSAVAPTESDLLTLRNRLTDFIRLELFRLESKSIFSKPEDNLEEQKEKISAYKRTLLSIESSVSQHHNELDTVTNFLSIASLVKQHTVSSNWFNPDSMVYFRNYFESMTAHHPYSAGDDPQAIKNYLHSFLLKEIIRLCLLNESDNTLILRKIEAYKSILNDLSSDDMDYTQLLSIINRIDTLADSSRARLSFMPPNSALIFNQHLRLLSDALKGGIKQDDSDWLIVADADEQQAGCSS